MSQSCCLAYCSFLTSISLVPRQSLVRDMILDLVAGVAGHLSIVHLRQTERIRMPIIGPKDRRANAVRTLWSGLSRRDDS